MFLETQLDRSLMSERTQIRFMRELLGNFAWIDLIAKEVHSRSDLEKFLHIARTQGHVRAVHIVSHGEETREASAIVLTEDEVVDLRHRDNRALFEDLDVETIFLSCCRLGEHREVMARLLEVSGAVGSSPTPKTWPTTRRS
jgi:tRNA G37 N-methylase Trm5